MKKGSNHSEETKKVLSRLYKGKTLEEIHGEKKAAKIRNKKRVSMLGKNKGKKRSLEQRSKLSRIVSKKWKDPIYRSKCNAWTSQDLEYLKANYVNVSNIEISRRLGRSVLALKAKAQKLGIKKSKEFIGRKKGFISSEKGKTFEEIYGVEKALKLRRKISDVRKGCPSPMKGKHHTETTKEKLSKSLSGRKRDYYSLGRLGTVMSKEQRKKLFEGRSKFWKERKEEMTGPNHPNWNGGTGNAPYPLEFNDSLKERIKKRDNYTCQKCGSMDKLCVHHIDYNKQNCSDDNLITLCNRCNLSVNFQRVFWQGVFTGIMYQKAFVLR